MLKPMMTAVGFLAVIGGCNSDQGPDESQFPPLPLEMELITIDGQPLPDTVLIDGETRVLRAVTIELSTTPPFVTWSMVTSPLGSTNVTTSALLTFYRRPRADSLVFPAGATPEFFGRLRGDTLDLVSRGTSPVSQSMAAAAGGDHNWRFEVVPPTSPIAARARESALFRDASVRWWR